MDHKGWLIPPGVKIGNVRLREVKAGVPAQVVRLATGQYVRVPEEPIDPSSIYQLDRQTDWATRPGGVIVVGGRVVGEKGVIQMNFESEHGDGGMV